jgi:hypothetical protein
MIKLPLLIIISLIIPFFSFGQSADSSHQESLGRELTDDRIIFTRAEYMPRLYNGVTALADSLTLVLRQNNSSFQKGTFLFSLTIGKNGTVKDARRQGELSEPLLIEAQIIGALKNTTGMWKPATQNGYPVNCFKLISIKFNKRTLEVTDPRP